MRKYFTNIDLEIEELFSFDFLELKTGRYSFGEQLGEKTAFWESPVYYSKEYYVSEYEGKARDYLLSEGCTLAEIESHEDTMRDDILRACHDAWIADVENNIFRIVEDELASPGFEFAAIEMLDENGKPTAYLFEASSVRYHFTRKQFRDMDSVQYCRDAGDSWAYIEDDAADMVAEHVNDNLEKIDCGRYGAIEQAEQWADCDDMLAYFRDYNETESLIFSSRKSHFARLKGWIKGKAPLIARHGIQEVQA